MELWSEYEGRTIAGSFPLKKLLQPEGRSAFFSTVNSKGVPTVIRLIESHYDEEEILARWREVEGLNHPNLLKLEQYGQIVLDDTPVVYAVMEPVDANLSEVLHQQRLTLPDAKQLFESGLSALAALHSQGFIHEHVEAANVFAVGEIVKLRSDCIRVIPQEQDAGSLKRHDFQDLSVLLLQALTQQKTLESAARDLPLPAPFDQIIRRGISGEWGEMELTAALKAADRPVVPPAPVPAPTPAAAPVAVPAPSRSAAVPAPTAAPRRTSGPVVVKRSKPTPPSRPIRRSVEDEGDDQRAMPIPRFGAGRPGTGTLLLIGLAVIFVLWFGWHQMHSGSPDQNNSSQVSSNPAPSSDSSAPKPSAGTPHGSAGQPAAQPAPQSTTAPATAAPSGTGDWRVVAYTYNMEENAKKKSETIARKHPELHPQVFAPSGHTPYLVTIGGAMSRDEAYALASKARQLGMPRDTYAQNYTSAVR